MQQVDPGFRAVDLIFIGLPDRVTQPLTTVSGVEYYCVAS